MTTLYILVAILGLAFLMVVHEAGHFFVAKYFGMRVVRFSIGFGPALYRKQPKGSPTTYQIAIIPFLAYVQIAGMNPFEELDPHDKGSYANARLHARILTIFAGPLANYLVASILFFGAFMIGGETVLTTTVDLVMPDMPGAAAQIKPGDKIVQIEGTDITEWEQLRNIISTRAGQKTDVVVERDGKRLTLPVVPADEDGQGRIGVQARVVTVPMSVGKAALVSLEEPPKVVASTVVGIGRIIMRQAKPEFAGPLGIVKETAKAVRDGFDKYLTLLAVLSAYLAAFNLLPFPALDGGRLAFLGYEAATRKRPNARIEAGVHTVGLFMLLALVAFVTIFSDLSRPGP